MANSEEDSCMPIAVIGMGCRFPGDATSPDHLWELISNGRSAWSEFPKDRINIDGFYHPSGDRQGSICFKGGHFLRDDIAAFDAPFFSMTAHEAAAVDPQQRFLLEVSYEAFENAGIPIESLPRSSTAVYCGSFVKDYEQICLRDPDDSPQYAATGNGIAIMSNRISWFYDLRGPSMTLDTGCSASLVGIHLACQSLRTGESKLALAMGAGMVLTPSTMLPMTALNFLSPDGKCFAFDERANGYGRGEGIGAVVLKPLAAAVRDNDTIRAVIRGSGVNQDGHTPGITMPSKEAQAINIRAVYTAAGLDYDRTAYFEAHGTGTQAGDPTELGAISETFAETRNKDDPIFVGSVKTNIGHLEGCAGIAGLVKGVLMLEKGQIPANLYFENVNPRIPLETWKIKVPQSLTPWPMDGLRRVSINCFGFGGTNAHIILDDAMNYMSDRGISGNHSSVDLSQPSSPATTESWVEVNNPPTEREPSWPSGSNSPARLYVLTAHEESGMARLSSVYSDYFLKQNLSGLRERDVSKFGTNLAYTLSSRRSKLPWKAYVVSSTPENLSTQFHDNLSRPKRSSQSPIIAFAFSGQGAQFWSMGRELLQYEVFSNCLNTADSYLRSLGCEWSLMTEFLKDEDKSIIDLPRISQPLSTALQIALVDLLEHWGVKPSSVVGHSSGEIAAAYTLGAITREAAWKLSYHRGRLTSAIKYLAPNLKGRMMAVALSSDSTTELLAEVKEGNAIVACINSPENVTVSGDEVAVLSLETTLKSRGIFARLLKVENAYHSFHMKIIERHYLQSIDGIQIHEAQQGRTMFSSVTGKAIFAGDLGKLYWAQNLVSLVQFSDAFTSLLRSKRVRPDVIVEIGPHGVLQGPMKQIIDARPKSKLSPTCLSILSRGKDAVITSLETVGRLWSVGCPVELNKVNTSLNCNPRVLTDLPTYPWNHTKRYWHESHLGSAHRFRKWGRQDLIGAQTADSIPSEPRWRGFIRLSENPWVEDHQVQNTIIYPAAGMISMALEAARQMQDDNRKVDGYEISKMFIDKAMIVPTSSHGLETAINAKIRISQEDVLAFDFTVYSKLKGANWVEHAHGVLTIRYKLDKLSAVEAENLDALSEAHQKRYTNAKEICTERVQPRQLYDSLESIGMKYGSTFQNITSIQISDSLSCYTIKIPDTASRMPANYEFPHLIHPATLDAMFQTIFAAGAGNEPMVPSFMERLFISADFPSGARSELIGHSCASRHGLRDALGSIFISNSSWLKPFLIVENLHFTALSLSLGNVVGDFLPNHHKLCAQLEWKEDIVTTRTNSFKEWFKLLAFKHLDLDILEIAGDGALLMGPILRVLDNISDSTPRMARYTVASSNSNEFENAQKHLLQWVGHMTCKIIKGTKDLSNQGFKLASFDLILINSVDIESIDSIAYVQDMLKSGGRLLHVKDSEVVRTSDGVTNIDLDRYRMVDGSGFISSTFKRSASKDLGFTQIPLMETSCPQEIASIHMISTSSPESLLCHEAVLILPDHPSMTLKGLSARIADLLLLANIKTKISTFLGPSETFSGQLCISLVEVDSPIFFNLTNDQFNAFRSIIQVAKGSLWVTKGGQADCVDPFSSLASTLCRTIRSEDSQKLIYTLDLDPATGLDIEASTRAIVSTIFKSFNPKTTNEEMEYAERGGKILIPRIQLQVQLSSRIERGEAKPLPRLLPFYQPGRPLKSEIGTLGDLKSLCFIDDVQATSLLDCLDIEVKVVAAGVKMLDVKTMLGQTSYDTIGTDVSGVITKVGSSVSRFKAGDRVATLVLGAYKSFIRVTESMCQLIPENMSFEIAASLPSNLASAYYSLITIGRLEKDEFILIHDAASALGQTAIQIAQAMGAKIFATFQNQEENLLIKSYGIDSSYLFAAGSSQLIRKVEQVTNGQGIDLVLNTLPRENLEHTWKVINPFGRFIELSSYVSNDVRHTYDLRNITFTRVDLGAMIKHNIPLTSRLLCSSFHMVRDGKIKEAKGISAYPISELVKACQEVQKGAQVVVTINANDLVPVVPRDEHPLKLEAEATYVLVGGLGGLGRSLAALMIRHGARNLAFLSRSGATSDDQVRFINGLAAQGVQGRVYKCDICVKSQLLEAIRKCESEMPRIRGVIQGAAVVKDAIFDNMTYEDWVTATQPKIQGSWNLHEVMPADLDFFVFLSSSAAVIGARGQANYASGNAFQDALAQYRRGKGLAAVSLDLGPILGVGMVAEDEATADILRAGGFFGVREKDFYLLVIAAMTGYTEDNTPTPSQVIIATGTGGLVKQNQVSDPYWYREARFSHMKYVDVAPQTMSTEEASIQELLSTCSSLSEASAIILEGLTTLLAKSMNMLPGDLDTKRAANSYGVDSLVAVGTRNWIFKETGVDVSVFEILSEAAIEELAGQIAAKCRFVSPELRFETGEEE